MGLMLRGSKVPLGTVDFVELNLLGQAKRLLRSRALFGTVCASD